MGKGHTFLQTDAGAIQELNRRFGDRGGYIVDPYWFRINTLTGKPELWNAEKKKWNRINLSERFDWDDNGNVVQV